MLRSGREITGEKKILDWAEAQGAKPGPASARAERDATRERAPGPAGCVLSERMDVIRLCLAAAAQRGVISQSGLYSLIRCNA